MPDRAATACTMLQKKKTCTFGGCLFSLYCAASNVPPNAPYVIYTDANGQVQKMLLLDFGRSFLLASKSVHFFRLSVLHMKTSFY